MSFVPFAHNNLYVHLPKNAEFCVNYGRYKINYKTDGLGGRIFSNKKNQTQVYGDSQVLGIDINTSKKHYLSDHIKNDFVIYAAPNNGPYEVLEFIKLNKEHIAKNIIINFNLSVDIFRVYEDWDINNYVAVKSEDLNEIVANPYKYKILITKNLLSNKFFTVSRKDNDEMRRLFISRNQKKLIDNINLYIKNLEKISDELDIDFELIFTMPYWIYKNEEGKIKKIKFIEDRLKNILCKILKNTGRPNNYFISKLKNSYGDIYTVDNRHLRSNRIVLTKLGKYCSI